MEIEESENPEKYKPYTRQMGKNAKEVTLMKSLFELYGGPAGIRTPDLHLVRVSKTEKKGAEVSLDSPIYQSERSLSTISANE